MTNTDLDLLVDIVEETTAYLKQTGALTSDYSEFVVSRLLEFGLRGKKVHEALRLLKLKRDSVSWEFQKHSLPAPLFIMDLGAAVGVARRCMEHGENMTTAAQAFGIRGHLGCRLLGRCFGMRSPEIKGRTWQELVDIFLIRRWPEMEESSAA